MQVQYKLLCLLQFLGMVLKYFFLLIIKLGTPSQSEKILNGLAINPLSYESSLALDEPTASSTAVVVQLEEEYWLLLDLTLS